MSKNITINEGGVAKQLTVDKLKTNLVGGSTCLWVPEDGVHLTTKNITENGTYKASDDGYYGYEQVTVNVAGVGTVTGKDGDGDEAVVHADPDTGELVTDKVPSRIEVVTPPTNPYGIYTNGQTISTTGMVVKAYLASGAEYGVVPNAEITINPTTAVYDASTDTGGVVDDFPDYASGGTIESFCSLQAVLQTALSKIPTAYTFSDAGFPSLGGKVGYVVVSTSSNAFQGKSPLSIYIFDGLSVGDSISGSVTATVVRTNGIRAHDGEEIVITYVDTIASSNVPFIGEKTDSQNWYGSNINAIASQPGSHQTITVSWPRPHDGKVLETTFEILVAPGYTPNGGEE